MLDSVLYKIRNCAVIISFAFFSFILFSFWGCSRINDGKIRGAHAIDDAMDIAENIMDDDPVGSDSLMRLIDPSAVRSKERLARYALLYTAAEYKNYQTISSDSLIMIAVRHYTINNNLDYRFLSYYYLGCVYMELRQYTDAAVAFTQAEQLDDRIANDFWKGLLYSQLGVIFKEACDYHRAVEYYSKAKDCFENAGKERHKLYSLYNVGDCLFNMEEFNTSDSIIQIVEKRANLINDSVLYINCLYNRLYCTLYLEEMDSAKQILKEYLRTVDDSLSFSHFEIMALYYNTVKEYDKSESFLEQSWSCNLSTSDSIYLYYVSSLLAENKGQIEESLALYRKFTSLQNDNLRSVLSQPVLAAQKEQYKILAENELLKNRHARMTLMLCVVIFMLIIVIVLVTYHYKKKHMKEQLYDSLAIVDELTGKIEQLKNQVRVQFHERHDLSNRLYSMYFDSESQDKVTKQQLNVTINSLIKDYTAPDSVRRLDALINESYDGIMDRLVSEDIGLSDKELQLLRFSFAGLSSKSVSVIIKESPQNIYQIKSRLLKKVRRNSEELWETLNTIC